MTDRERTFPTGTWRRCPMAPAPEVLERLVAVPGGGPVLLDPHDFGWVHTLDDTGQWWSFVWPVGVDLPEPDGGVRPVVTAPVRPIEVRRAVNRFLNLYREEGMCLRMEDVSGMTGRRITLTFQWEHIE